MGQRRARRGRPAGRASALRPSGWEQRFADAVSRPPIALPALRGSREHLQTKQNDERPQLQLHSWRLGAEEGRGHGASDGCRDAGSAAVMQARRPPRPRVPLHPSACSCDGGQARARHASRPHKLTQAPHALDSLHAASTSRSGKSQRSERQPSAVATTPRGKAARRRCEGRRRRASSPFSPRVELGLVLPERGSHRIKSARLRSSAAADAAPTDLAACPACRCRRRWAAEAH
ncbi:hypothetical protein FA09DRAFT_23286 [Tilletiopsis washingtonensis]|jgi:hypothetical protein|uniref:Uncharacterized protein n=1 Tax=Tilletiopsis washingtonensis TaxID=58919 RepID=A0A316ZB60_9BASI|nr:hypothetical protein FA09DRAFT_23286 [Tilletiopsis washingtonensis]PWN98258.1 hypothetical protein FA09DRAFT_23286 [Tilletiopsis washingtonensis]